MKLLCVASWPPFPLNSGGRLRTHEMLEFLRQRHQVQLITFVGGPRERAEAQRQGAFPVSYQPSRADSSLPAVLRPFDAPELQQLLLSLAAQGYQATLFEQIFVSGHRSASCGPAVLLEHNIESEILRQFAERAPADQRRLRLAQALALRAYEQEIWPQFAMRCCVSEHDAQLMRSRCPDGNTLVIPNGVNLHRYQRLSRTDEARLLFVGALDYLPNQDAVTFLCQQILPLIWTQLPEFRLRIVGRNPPPEIRDLLAVDARLELVADAGDLTDLARSCSLSVVPLRMGSGTRLKILEAAAWGLPVITTSLGVQGLDLQDGVHLRVANSPDDFAHSVVDLWSQPELRQQLAQAARLRIEQSYDWARLFPPLEQALLELVHA